MPPHIIISQLRVILGDANFVENPPHGVVAAASVVAVSADVRVFSRNACNDEANAAVVGSPRMTGCASES